jgi:outer membrane protein OmpA-like peptidoglycan-associated protein
MLKQCKMPSARRPRILQSAICNPQSAIPSLLPFALALLLPCSLSFGFLGDDAGTSVLPLLRTSVGPRASAMGDCFVALSDDATGVFWNPAGLGQSLNAEYFLAHNQWFQGFHDEFASLAAAAGGGRLGLGLVYSGVSGIESWDADNMQIGKYSTYTGIGSIGYGHRVADGYFIGGTARFLYDRLDWVNGFGGCLDLGFLARPLKFLSAGIALQNLGWGMYYSNATYRLPMLCRAGVSLEKWDFRLVADAEVPLWSSPCFHVGGEFTPISVIAFRAGYRTGPQDISTLGGLSGLSAGLGLNLGGFSLDYAFAPYGKLGFVHRLGIRARAVPRGYGTIRVRVFEAGVPYGVPAKLEFSGPSAATRAARDDGKAELTRLTEGWLKVKASLEGFVPATDSVYVKGDREQNVVLTLHRPGAGVIWGMFIDAATRQTLAGRIQYTGPVSGGLDVSDRDASYSLRGMSGGSYVLTAFGPSADYIPQTCTVSVETSLVVSHDFMLSRKLSATLALNGVVFDSGSAEIRKDAYAHIDELGQALQNHSNLVIELSGYADQAEAGGTQTQVGWMLSEARAQAVAYYLATRFGISDKRLQVRGYADMYPAGSNNLPAGRAKNRRVELSVIRE